MHVAAAPDVWEKLVDNIRVRMDLRAAKLQNKASESLACIKAVNCVEHNKNKYK